LNVSFLTSTGFFAPESVRLSLPLILCSLRTSDAGQLELAAAACTRAAQDRGDDESNRELAWPTIAMAIVRG
jgi:hypothetical protein